MRIDFSSSVNVVVYAVFRIVSNLGSAADIIARVRDRLSADIMNAPNSSAFKIRPSRRFYVYIITAAIFEWLLVGSTDGRFAFLFHCSFPLLARLSFFAACAFIFFQSTNK